MLTKHFARAKKVGSKFMAKYMKKHRNTVVTVIREPPEKEDIDKFWNNWLLTRVLRKKTTSDDEISSEEAQVSECLEIIKQESSRLSTSPSHGRIKTVQFDKEALSAKSSECSQIAFDASKVFDYINQDGSISYEQTQVMLKVFIGADQITKDQFISAFVKLVEEAVTSDHREDVFG